LTNVVLLYYNFITKYKITTKRNKMNTKLEVVKFHDDFLEVVKVAGNGAVGKVAGQYWVSVKKVCENLGIDFKYQKNKLKSDEYEAKLVKVLTNGGVQEVFCIPLEKLNGWLFSINPNRVKPEVKEKLIAYKKECFDVLFNHFTNKVQQPPKNLLDEADNDFINELVKRTDIVRGYQGTIKRLENELAEKQSKLKEYERLLDGDADLYFRALESFLDRMDNIKKEMEIMKSILTSEPSKNQSLTYWGKSCFPTAKYSKDRLKRLV